MSEQEFEIKHGGLIVGGALSLVAAAALWIGLGYGLGSWMRVGAGAFPVVVAGLMFLCGLTVMAETLWERKRSVSIPLGAIRSGLAIITAIAAFALSIQGLGLLAAVALCVFFVALATPQINWRHTIGLMIVLPVSAWLIFALGLGQRLHAFG